MSEIKPIYANSREGGDVYRLLNMVHAMAGSLANSPSKLFTLARTQSDPAFAIVTVWTNGVVDIEAKTWRNDESGEPPYHEYSITHVKLEAEETTE